MRTILRFPRSVENSSKSAHLAAIDDRYDFSVKFADVNISTPEEVAELLAFWHPDGCIVNNDRLPMAAFAAYPTLFQHRVSETDNPRHATIAFDEKAVAETAAHHLLSLDLASYAYVPPPANEQWSSMREQHFVHILGLNGHGVASYVHPRNRLSAPKRLTYLADWLANLPRPVGVFAANDTVASTVIATCDHRQLDIPQDIVVLGVDNDETVCEMTRPTLSSIATDIVTVRDESHRLLERLISGEPLECRQAAWRRAQGLDPACGEERSSGRRGMRPHPATGLRRTQGPRRGGHVPLRTAHGGNPLPRHARAFDPRRDPRRPPRTRPHGDQAFPHAAARRDRRPLRLFLVELGPPPAQGIDAPFPFPLTFQRQFDNITTVSI